MTHDILDPVSVATAVPPARLRAVGLSVGYGDQPVVKDLDLDLVDHAITTVIGPNGCGKSTLLRSLGRLLRPAAGQVLLDGKRIDKLPTKQVATELALLPQSPIAPEGLVVRDLVARGRHPQQSWLRQWSADDERVVDETLAWTSMTELADRPIDQLSGGQRQRAWIAMALAQQTDLVLLDEPTTYLDLSHQIDVLDLARTLNRDHGRTVVMVLHDLNLAARYSDCMVAMRDGEIVASGEPAAVITPALLREVFSLDAQVIEDPVTGKPMVVPIGCVR
ncbi:ABC transporter ATP-binding protein [Nocardioides marmoriginsengisoli]|uniref:ABC transporter ATP-binding protein n=1 Tax=Nocardioides marmoriginsengisoli TaxID=661483 RepID=A0A3N0CJY3_9ACTN|nr:ABC transporter ATP-binding protein [Nocardioides marmoriginsengisoli]RNL63760.1 ABC transporter ATP-binding protein [Nocardioides marmoriginsengisoli]